MYGNNYWIELVLRLYRSVVFIQIKNVRVKQNQIMLDRNVTTTASSVRK